MSRRKRTSSPIDRFGGKNPSRLDPDDETVIVAVRVTRETSERLNARARELGASRSEVVRWILADSVG